jgi:hypothetical protein
LTDSELNKICTWTANGAKLYIGRDYAGRSKIKIVRGPLGIFTQRFPCEDQDVRELNRRLQERRLQSA